MPDESARQTPSQTGAVGHRRLAAILIVLAVVLANVAFVGLGTVFEYPDILQQPTEEILAKFRADQATIVSLFAMLALASALLAPIAVLLGRMAGNELGRWSIGVGIAAAVVQVVGCSVGRWSSRSWPTATRPTRSRSSTRCSARSWARPSATC